MLDVRLEGTRSVAPISSYTSKNLLPSHVKIEAGQGGLVRDCLVKLEQSIRMAENSLKQKIGSVSAEIKDKLIDSFNDITGQKE
ncbi:type II toxin-antitoxin system PemK/MazF family toxin [Desulfosporosinus hippei]|uniref:PemK-like, MazF-like toxin of type II toxin-antitoxin system n=1 Tax=Desulfosporosinus hippei DSM 8344 TaxID=1121419 RepID=A0A1G7Z730_9FIRM|nr:type II toxin-antitoxin system PemK/MazF family toxin [Desulfosporosinus hippei]SDH04306.1 PemK-like, MazF-like toxin of type II toxin-antitoxin system [Desulfosporosinus hippei DSM 8344]